MMFSFATRAITLGACANVDVTSELGRQCGATSKLGYLPRLTASQNLLISIPGFGTVKTFHEGSCCYP